MVVTILPANFMIVEANDTNGAIYLKVTGASNWTKAGDIKVTVTDSTGKEVEQKFVRTKVVEAQTDSGNTNPDNTNPDNTDSGNNNPGNTDTGKDDAAGKDTENTGSESGSDNSNEPAGQADEQQDAKPVAINSIKIDVTDLVKDSNTLWIYLLMDIFSGRRNAPLWRLLTVQLIQRLQWLRTHIKSLLSPQILMTGN